MKKLSFKEVGKPALILFVICIIVAGALAVTNMLTKDKIAQNALEDEIAARQAVLAGDEYELVSEENGVSVYAVLVYEIPDGGTPEASGTDVSATDVSATDVTPTDIAEKAGYRLWTGLPSQNGSEAAVSPTDVSPTDVSGSDISATDASATDMSATDVSGTDISATDMSTDRDRYIIGYVAVASSKGYGGDVQIMIGVDLELKITGIEILDQSETAGLGANCENRTWLSQFVGQSGTLAVSKDGGDIDAITAATITSRAVTSAVNKALSQVTEIEGRMNVQ